ncbi:MAG: SMC-Scp complex subunit ScpB [Lentisphaerae bacterium]|jgi:segregation and condensation protein B|nr:SMC-Scp complex subunit ScpB [Lentisphaerota bacterium]
MQNLFEPETSDPSIRQIICALILGSDHPISAKEIQAILEAVAEDDRKEEEEQAKEVTDEELEATQEAITRIQKNGPPDESASEKPPVKDATPKEESTRATHTDIISISHIKSIIAELQTVFKEFGVGVELMEVSDGYRFQTSSDCGKWVRKMLNKGKPTRLTRPTIETLAIIAYRQPVTRSEIESIRGVSAGHVIKALMEMQLVKMIGRSELPGRPFLFGTTETFLNHFGLKSLKDLKPIEK